MTIIIVTIGIDLTKNIFAVHGVNESGHAEPVKPKVYRDQPLPPIANFPRAPSAWKPAPARTVTDYGKAIAQVAREDNAKNARVS